MPPPSVTAVIPMYNEAPYVERCLQAVREAILAVTPDLEIIVVDDASTDGTGDRVRSFAEREPRVRLLTNETNRTLGGTLRRGFDAATKDLIFYTDADLPFDLGLLGKAVRLLRFQQADLVCAFRFQRTEEGPLRSLYSAIYNGLVRLVLRVRIRDVNFSFKLFRRAILPDLRLESEGSFIDAEMVAKAHHLGSHIIQFGVDYFPRSVGVSKLSGISTIVGILRELLAQRRGILRIARARPAPSGTGAPEVP